MKHLSSSQEQLRFRYSRICTERNTWSWSRAQANFLLPQSISNSDQSLFLVWTESLRVFFYAECCFLFPTLILLLLLCLFLLVSIESCLGWRGGIPPTADAGGGRMNYIHCKKRLSVVSASIPANLFWPVMILVVLWRLKYTVDFAIKLNDQVSMMMMSPSVSSFSVALFIFSSLLFFPVPVLPLSQPQLLSVPHWSRVCLTLSVKTGHAVLFQPVTFSFSFSSPPLLLPLL